MMPRVLSALKVLSAGCLVYLAMAACSSETSSPAGTGPGTGNEAGTGTSPVPNAMADENYASGSRLKIQTLEGADGSKQFFGWFDSEKQWTCGFQEAGFGSYRCIPAWATAGVFFADAGCQTTIAAAPKAGPTPKIARKGGYYELGAKHVTPVWQGVPGACSGVGIDVINANDFWAVGAEISDSVFAAATLKTAQ